MYLHLGQDTVITTETVIGIFDMDECTVSKKTGDYLTAAEKRGRVVNVSFELPKSFVVCEKNGKITVYISQLSSKTEVNLPIRSLCTVDTDIKRSSVYENEKMPLLRKKNFIYLIVCKQKKSRIYLPKVRKREQGCS